MSEQHPMTEMALDFMHMEATGQVRDSVYYPTDEDLTDPDHHEVAGLVMEQYAHENGKRREDRLRAENAALRSTLEEYGIDVSDL